MFFIWISKVAFLLFLINSCPFVTFGKLIFQILQIVASEVLLGNFWSYLWIQLCWCLFLRPIWDNYFLVKLNDCFGPLFLYVLIGRQLCTDFLLHLKLEGRYSKEASLGCHRVQIFAPETMQVAFWISFWSESTSTQNLILVNMVNFGAHLRAEALYHFVIVVIIIEIVLRRHFPNINFPSLSPISRKLAVQVQMKHWSDILILYFVWLIAV